MSGRLLAGALGLVAIILLPAIGAAPDAGAAGSSRKDGCEAEGYLSVNRPSGGGAFLSHRVRADGSFELTDDRADALQVFHTWGEAPGEFTVIDPRVPDLVAVAAFLPAGAAALAPGSAEYLTIGGATGRASTPRTLTTTAGTRTAATDVFWFDFSGLGPGVEWRNPDGSVVRGYDSWMTPDGRLLFLADAAAYEAAYGPVTRAGIGFVYTDLGPRCPGTELFAGPTFDQDPEMFPPQAGDRVLLAAVALSAGRVDGELAAFACGPTPRPEECETGGQPLGTARLLDLSEASATFEFVPSSGGTYCFRLEFRGQGLDDAASSDTSSCVRIEGPTGQPLPIDPRPSTSPPSMPDLAPPGAPGDTSALVAVSSGAAILGLAAIVTAVILVVRRRRHRSPAADQPTDVGGPP